MVYKVTLNPKVQRQICLYLQTNILEIAIDIYAQIVSGGYFHAQFMYNFTCIKYH
jgi:hypothetical protein